MHERMGNIEQLKARTRIEKNGEYTWVGDAGGARAQATG